VSPAELAKQEKAYQELMESNPFLMVAYDDFAGLDRSRANARQKSNIPAEEQALVGPRGIVGGNPAVVAEVSKSEGSSKADLFRVPADLSGGDPAGELARRTVDGLSGRAPAPEKLKDTAKETRDSWVGGL
jgi:hypothetical protein